MLTKKKSEKFIDDPMAINQPHSAGQMSTYGDNMNQLATKSKTRVTAKYDVGFSNVLYIRGQGAGLNWDKGIPMKNVKADEWVWETDARFTTGEFKVLINDRIFEQGNNHQLKNGSNNQFSPRF